MSPSDPRQGETICTSLLTRGRLQLSLCLELPSWRKISIALIGGMVAEVSEHSGRPHMRSDTHDFSVWQRIVREPSFPSVKSHSAFLRRAPAARFDNRQRIAQMHSAVDRDGRTNWCALRFCVESEHGEPRRMPPYALGLSAFFRSRTGISLSRGVWSAHRSLLEANPNNLSVSKSFLSVEEIRGSIAERVAAQIIIADVSRGLLSR
jgi:hypothetical protein